MEFKDKEIISDKVINKLDRIVINFINFLEKHTQYVIVSGYVSIVLGRSRATEDIDILIPKMNFADFKLLFDELLKSNYECANTSISKDAYELMENHAVRFYEGGFPIPNIELKFIKREIDNYAFDNRLKLVLSEKTLFISPIELQIAYKLFLSSEEGDKDVEDAMHLYKIYKERINKDKLLLFAEKLGVKNKLIELK